MQIKKRNRWMFCCIIVTLYNFSTLTAQNSLIILGGGTSLILTADGENRSYLKNTGTNNGAIIVNNGASLTTWSPDALIGFSVTGEGNIVLSVELFSFNAHQEAGVVYLEWTTESEIDNLGFYLYRSLERNGKYSRITNQLIKGTGTTTEGKTYNYTDRNVDGEITYWYKLEDISFDGIRKMHGPISVTVNFKLLPQIFTLRQNYPNPFNPFTEINFDLPQASLVKLYIYNVSGKLIRTLINQNFEAGRHTKKWYGIDEFGHEVASGVYVYVIHAGSFNNSKKMILLR